MPTTNFLINSNGPTRRNTSRALPFILAARKPNRPLPMISLRVPVTPANRNYLRELRNAELRAWQSTRRLPPLRTAAANARREQRDLYMFGLIVAMTLTLTGVILAQSPGATQRVAHWVNVVRNVLG